MLIFPTGNVTWVYDVVTQLWHEKESYPVLIDGTQGRHRSNCYANFAGKHLVGDYLNGKIYEMDMDTYTDNGEVIRRARTTEIVHAERKRLFFNKFEVEFEAGVGLVSGQGSDPQAMLQWSDDNGHTWSNEHWRGIGAIGKYSKRAIWNRCGQSRNRSFKISMTDPVKPVILNATASIDIGEN